MKKSEETKLRKILKVAGLGEEELNNHLATYKLLKKYVPITLQELFDMAKDEKRLSKLLSVCWKDGHLRCYTTGISNVVFDVEKNKTVSQVHYSDSDGDPDIDIRNLDWDTTIHKLSRPGGTWSYGLYVKK